uniref:Uncharacterized protein n=1 Tax=Fagus sylvatica TaxID=28930 RepID=A0A2N9ESD9_FAGSY
MHQGGPVGEPPMLKSDEVETSFNEKASLRTASDACRLTIGRSVPGVVSSAKRCCFRQRGTRAVLRVAGAFTKSNLGPPPLEGYISPDSVLHRLAAELYSIVYPALSTWESVRNRIAANEAEWSLPLLEELPEGLSSESAGRVVGEVSSEVTSSTSGSRQLPRVNRSWRALSYFSKINQDVIDRIRRHYQIPDDVVLRIPNSDERACCPKYEGDVAFYEADLRAGLRFPMQPFVRELLDFLSLAPGVPSSDRIWKDGYFFCGDTGRGSHKRILDFVRVRSIGSSVAEFRVEEDIEGFGDRGPSTEATRQSGEVATDPVILKRKRADEGSSKRAEEAPTRPPVQEAVPLVRQVPPIVMVDVDPASPTDPSVPPSIKALTWRWIKPRELSPLGTWTTMLLLILKTSIICLNEAMVMSQRCIAVEEDLATLRAKCMADEAEMKNAKRAVLELTRERKDALVEVEKLKKELKARDDDVKVAVDAKDKAVADLKHLVGQIEGAKEAAVSEFRASEAFEDINTRYFLFGFEAFRKQVVQRFPGLDFSAFQPYDDDDSVVNASQNRAGDDDVSSK